MQALNAGLAFGITMFVLATVVSSLVETLHRAFGLREKGLAILLSNFYERVIVTRARDIQSSPQDRQRFIDMMTANRGPVGGVKMPGWLAGMLPANKLGDSQFLNWIWGGRRLGSLDVSAFMERLGGSEYGASLVMQGSQAGRAGTEWLLKDLAQKFEAYGSEASQYFESRARLLSVIVGFVMAFAINVNALVLFETFSKHPEIAQRVIDSQDKIQADAKAFEERVTALNTAVAQVQQQADTDTQSGRASPEMQKQLADTRTALNEARAAAQTSAGDLTSAGVTIGWRDVDEFTNAFKSLRAILGLLLGGLLIGLGAPFWYKVVQNLTVIRSLVGGGKEPDKGATASGVPAAPSGPTETPTSPIDKFHAALGAALAAGELAPFEEAVG